MTTKADPASERARKLRSIGHGLATAVMCTAAVVVAFIAVRNELRKSPGSLKQSGQFEELRKGWETYASAGRRIGSADARVTLVEFADFQCPACRHFEERLREARAKFGDAFSVVYRHLPLSIHSHARGAAVANECAGRQERFEAMHDILFDVGDSLGTIPWSALAERVGVADVKAFEACLTEEAALAPVLRDSVDAIAVGARGTPTSIINGVRVRGALSQRTLDSLISDALGNRRD